MTPLVPTTGALSAGGPMTMFNGSGPAADSNEAVAAEFESVLLSMLVSSMRKSSFGEGLFPGDKSDTLGGMFDMMIAGQMSDSGGVGVQALVNRWLTDQANHAARGPENVNK